MYVESKQLDKRTGEVCEYLGITILYDSLLIFLIFVIAVCDFMKDQENAGFESINPFYFS